MDACCGRRAEMRNLDEDSCDSKRRKTAHCTCLSSKKRNRFVSSCSVWLMSNLSVLTLTLILASLVQPPGLMFAKAEQLSEVELCKRGEYFEDYALKGGSKAGKYIKLGKPVYSFDDCVELCCQDKDCKMALMLKRSCFRVDCHKGDPYQCERISARRSKFNPKLFIRGVVEKPLKGR